jgi:ubiquinone/menaquinone biosynthesis C-methylase UbiE
VGSTTGDNVTVSRYADPSEVSSYVSDHDGWGPTARYRQSRVHVVEQVLRTQSGGDLLDVGCGPGEMVVRLLGTREDDFRITACDRSPAMIDAVAGRVDKPGVIRLSVANIEELPFEAGEFDVVLAMGVLEYVGVRHALHEISRVVRDDGLVMLTMLNPLSPYRIFEWCVYWPALRLLGQVEGLLRVPAGQRHGVAKSGIRAMRPGRLRRLMRNEGLSPQSLVYYDVTALLPPFDKVIRRWTTHWRSNLETTVGTGIRGRLGTGYLLTARRTDGGRAN